MQTKHKFILIGIFALSLCLLMLTARGRFFERNRERTSAKIDVRIIAEAEKAQFVRWKQRYGHMHPRSTVRKIEVDPRSRRLRVRIKTYMPGCQGCMDETWGAVSLYLNGHLQEKSTTGASEEIWELENEEKAGEYGIFFFELFSVKPITDGNYQLKVVDNKSGDKHEVDLKIRHGKVVVKPKAERK